MNTLSRFAHTVMKLPIVWGILACAAFYGLIFGGPLDLPIMHRYFTHHPVEYGETLLFSVGMAALMLRLTDVITQRLALGKSPWKTVAPGQLPLDELCRTLDAELERQPAHRRDEYYLGRLRAALHYVRRLGSTEGIGDELKYLTDLDGTRAHGRYGLFRVIVWAIPILGFLGTVIGITLALNGIDPKSPDESMLRVITGLGLKFDTTAVALSLSMVLVFVHFFADRAETALLTAVDFQVESELAEYLPAASAGPDGQIMAMRRMAEVMVTATDRLIERQAQLWLASMEAAALRWTEMGDSAAANLTRALDESLKHHAERLAASEETVAKQGRQQWEKIAQAQLQHVQSLAGVQDSLAQQAETMGRILQATGDVEQLQDVLNRNLAALAGAKNFEQTVLGLAAAIHLLNGRMVEATLAVPAVQLESKRRTTKAA
ncbi:MAG: MotA/TolQ/ExbB proton channel family protein [Planctomycetota bacterium]